MIFDPYRPPRSDVSAAPPAGRINRYYRAVNWLYISMMAFGFFFLLLGRNLDADWSTWLTVAIFLAPVAGYFIAASDNTLRYKLWRIVHLFIVVLLVALAAYDLLRSRVVPGPAWFLVLANVVSLVSNEYFRRRRAPVSR